jgi:hypothetical protein
MTTILILNALSSLAAAVAIGLVATRRRRVTGKILVQPVYVTTPNSALRRSHG